MEFYKRLVIKVLERSSLASDNPLLMKLKSGHDLTQKEMAMDCLKIRLFKLFGLFNYNKIL